jgi:adenylate kinase family enzyme
MRRILVIGSSGAGKTTFSRRLGDVTGIEVVHLDKVFWRPNWTETPKDEWAETISRLLEKDSWIVDGNYGGTMEMRLSACDTAIFLDMPRTLCVWRILKRVVRYRDGTRPDMADGCRERFDWEFLKWVWNYPVRSKPGVEDRLTRYRSGRNVYTLRSQRDVDAFLKRVGAERTT